MNGSPDSAPAARRRAALVWHREAVTWEQPRGKPRAGRPNLGLNGNAGSDSLPAASYPFESPEPDLVSGNSSLDDDAREHVMLLLEEVQRCSSD